MSSHGTLVVNDTAATEKKRVAKYPGTPITTNGNQLVAYYTEARLADAGIFYPITPSTEQGENYQLSFAQGQLNVFGDAKIAIETEGEHAAQGGAIAYSVLGKRVVNFTSGQGLAYGLEQYYHAPGKLSTMVVEVAARALTKHALNVHCGHDDVYIALDTGWIILFGKDAQQAADQALILRRVTELALTPGINSQDGFLTSHLERTFLNLEADLIREYLGRADDIIDCPTEAQRALFGPRRRRVPAGFDLTSPTMLGTVQNQEHYMQGVAARRHHFVEPILGFLEKAYEEFAELTGREYGLLSSVNCEKADTVFVTMGSAAENIEAAIDHIRQTRGGEVGSIHVNVLRPFPEAAIIRALAGKRNVLVLERIDDQTSPDGPLARDIRTALGKAVENSQGLAHDTLPTLAPSDVPRIFSGVYGLGSRDFRPEGVLGAYDFATGRRARQDGKKADEGASFCYVGIDHPYAVVSDDTPSLLPESAIAVRFHSIGGWGMITTGKNLGVILGDLGVYMTKRDHPEAGPGESILHVSANPKYGSEKKGAPTNYFLVVADERIRVNCDLRHVGVVLCCDPRVFTHSNPLEGLEEGGAFVWESNEPDDMAVWTRIPPKYRQEIIEKNIQVHVLSGFAVAKAATDRQDLQYRMQGNAFLGAFFRVSPFLEDHKIPEEEFLATVKAQYEAKFGRFGKAVTEANMTVMREGFSQVRPIPHGPVDAEDRSSMRGEVFIPLSSLAKGGDGSRPKGDQPKAPLFSKANYDSEFRAGLGYDTPSSPRASTGAMAAATGATISKYAARREVPMFIAENCTQCMACINACPDTALPNTAQEVDTFLATLIGNYVSSPSLRSSLLADVPKIDVPLRAAMRVEAAKKGHHVETTPFSKLLVDQLEALASEAPYQDDPEAYAQTVDELRPIIERAPAAFAKTNLVFGIREKKDPGSGGIFSIFVNDLCKGCGECVHECGDHNALVMVEETDEINADHLSGVEFLNLLPDTPSQFLAGFDPDNPLESRTAALHFHLMVQRNYQALASGDGACAGCGEKSVLRALATTTESLMRPLFHRKADRLDALATQLAEAGVARFERLQAESEDAYRFLRRGVMHLLMGLGGEDDKDTDELIRQGYSGDDNTLVQTLIQTLRADAYRLRDLQAIEGGPWNGMSTMGMAASTGCNTVYGSTHPNNPHPYPWVNSLFQDGATVGWLLAEGFIVDHGRRSVIPERLSRALMDSTGLTEVDYWDLTHFNDNLMTDQEVMEMPKVWAVGGDGAFGDIGYQNLSKAVLQNRPNLKIVMLDTQVYSNTGGQNSDSSPMLGGFDMNQIGKATEGKLTEKKGVAETFLGGHGSPYVAQVSMANAANLFRTMLDGLAYRGTCFIQSFTTCQPEHGVADDVATLQAQLIRDGRGMPEFVFDPQIGEAYEECLSLKGNPSPDKDWHTVQLKATKERYLYTTAHWARTEARLRRHFHKVTEEDMQRLASLEDLLPRITMTDMVQRRFLDPTHRSFIPKEGAWTKVMGPEGGLQPIGISRQLVLFCVERRKGWRMLQSKAGLRNLDRLSQFRVLKEHDEGKIPEDVFKTRMPELLASARKLVEQGSKDAVMASLAETVH